jgi:hypothetical protein
MWYRTNHLQAGAGRTRRRQLSLPQARWRLCANDLRHDAPRAPGESESRLIQSIARAPARQLKAYSMDVLNWSKRGDVGCATHSPDPESERWRLEGWRLIPENIDGRHGRWFQCPSCDPLHRSYRSTAPNGSAAAHESGDTREERRKEIETNTMMSVHAAAPQG